MLSRDELAAWLRLATTPGIGRGIARQLLSAFGSPERVLAADGDALHALAGADVVDVLKRRAKSRTRPPARALRGRGKSPRGAQRG